MASAGKKGKKGKSITIPWTDFCQDNAGKTSVSKWSDEVENSIECRRSSGNLVLPTAPRAARGPDISEDRIPLDPPYKVYISNLPYDVDEEDISNFFTNMQIQNMRLPRDEREGGKLKGYGYVEFVNRTSLIDAVCLIDTNLKGRRIKIDISTNIDKRGRMDMGRDRMDRPEIPPGDWRSGPRSDLPPDSRVGGRDGASGFGRERGEITRDRDREFTRDRDFTRDREDGGSSSYGSFSRDRDSDSNRSGTWRDGDRSSFKDDQDRERSSYREGGFSDRLRYGDRDRGSSGFGTRRAGGDSYEKDGMITKWPRNDMGTLLDKGEPRTRPKLNLQPRSKPVDDLSHPPKGNEEPVSVAVAPVPADSIFGAAKPVDTSIKERQIEERLDKEKDTSRPMRDGSRERNRDDDEPRQESWTRKHNDERDDDGRRESPERISSKRGPALRKSDEKKPVLPRDRDLERAPVPKEEHPARRDDRPLRDIEREMPKLKEPEPPNFVASNIYASLKMEAANLSD